MADSAADTVGIVLAAGSARRMGKNKMLMRVGTKSVIERSLGAFEKAGCCDRIVIVCRPRDNKTVTDIAQNILSVPFQIVRGGKERQHSVENALVTIQSADVVIVHDGARCFINPDVIRECAAQAKKKGAAAAGVRTKDTIKQLSGNDITGTIDRTNLVNIQTPQACRYDLLMDAHRKAKAEGFVGTDECSLLERLNIPIRFVDAHYDNIKITTQEDILHGRHIVGETCTDSIRTDTIRTDTIRTGTGYDAHKLAEGRKLILGGVEIEHTHGLVGHSDADVIVHAVMDAMLGAAALGDIGQHFPSNDDTYKGICSIELLMRTNVLICDKGYILTNIDATVVMQRPKIAPYISAMRQNIAQALDVDVSSVSVKATTTEGMGFEGAGEGVSAMAVATLIG